MLNADSQKKYFNIPSVIIPNYYDFEVAKMDLRQKKSKTLAYIGRTDFEQKNLYYILDAWHAVSNKQDWILYLIGVKGSEIGSYIAKKQISNIRLVSHIENEKVRTFLESNSILLLASTYEGFPTVILEACSYANAIITTKYSGFSDELVKDGENGFVIDDRYNYSVYTEKIEYLLNNPNILSRMQEKSLLYYKEYSKINVIKLWNDELNKHQNEKK